MNEFNINFVGKEENIKKEEIFNNFDFNYLPINNLPISYFPLNNPLLSDELKNKDINSISNIVTDTITTEENIIKLDPNNKFIKITSNYNLKILKDIDVDLLLVGGGGGGGGKNIAITGKSNTINIVTNNPNYSYAFFANSGTIQIDKDMVCDILIVGGGGGGGNSSKDVLIGGGGGAGGVVYNIKKSLSKGIYNITVGDGGNANTNGSNSSIILDNTIIGTGIGGGAGGSNRNGNDGGSGGGGTSFPDTSGGSNTQNNTLFDIKTNILIKGGNSGSSGIFKIGGGGGGGGSNANTFYGGIGIKIDITGSELYYAGGGNSVNVDLDNNVNCGTHNGGGGNGCSGNGINNTGGGGGGGYKNYGNGNGGKGGSGVVIIRFETKYLNSGGGGGGEVKYLRDYKLKKGFYNINIGSGGNVKNNGVVSYIMKNNTNLIEAKGGNKGNGFISDNDINNYLGGSSHKNNLGKGADGNILNDNAQFGELIKIEEIKKYYGNGGLKKETTNKFINDNNNYYYSDDGRGGRGNLNTTDDNGIGNGKKGVFIIKYKNNDIVFIKKYGENTITSKIDISSTTDHSVGLSLEPTYDNPDYKLLVYRTSGSNNKLKLNKDIICDILIVGGGGYGGWLAGGGGGGGVININNYLLKMGDYTITIGNGGSEGGGYKGKNTRITSSKIIFDAGGGGNGGDYGSPNNYGSDIDVSAEIKQIGGKGGYRSDEYNGGGDGAGEKGLLGIKNKIAGNGGIGKLSNITGKNEYYGGGGGGASYGNIKKAGNGGTGGGGNGGINAIKAGENGLNNTGGGGGGLGINVSEGSGGSGIVIFRVKKEDTEDGLSKNQLDKLIDKDTIIINDIKDEFRKKIKIFENNDMPYNNFSILPLVILIILIWIFIFLFLLKFVHHYFANIYLYILLSIIIFLLLFGSLWFLYSNNDL